MPSSDNQGSSMPFLSFRRSILGIRNDQVHSMESSHDSANQGGELEAFQKQVSDRFHDLSSVDDDEFLNISWVQKLLNVFISCQDDFRTILNNNKEQISKPPLDRILSEFFDRTVKALDICNATREGIEKIQLWQKHLEIVLCAFDSQQRMIGEGHFRRARKALMDLALVMLDEKETGSVFSHRNRSFGNNSKNKEHRRHGSGHSRSLSWSVSHSWSAAKQIQSIANNLVPPRANEITATNGVVNLVYVMSSVLLLVLMALVAAFPCQDRAVQTHFAFPRQFSWSIPLHSLHNRIMEESRKRDRRSSNGLLKEIHRMEKCINHLTDLVDSVQFPVNEEQKEEVREAIQDLSMVFEVCKTGLHPLECQLREVFRKIMSCRTEGLEYIGRPNQA